MAPEVVLREIRNLAAWKSVAAVDGRRIRIEVDEEGVTQQASEPRRGGRNWCERACPASRRSTHLIGERGMEL